MSAGPQVDKEQLTSASALLIRKVKEARKNFAAFLKFVWANTPEFQLGDFHYEAISAYDNRDLKFVYWEAPRGHAKSMLTMAYVVFCLGQNPNLRVKIVCANDSEAKKRLSEIKGHMEKNTALRMVFPHLRPPRASGGEWNKGSVTVDRPLISKDQTIEAIGIMSGALGSRADLIIGDDIVDMRNSILQPELKRHVQQKLFGEIIPLLEPEGRFLAVGTPWTLSDVNAIMKESEGFYTVSHRVGDGAEDKCAPIWPWKQPRHVLEKMLETLGPAEYARAYLCQALTGDTVPIQAQWIKFYNGKLLGDPDDLYCVNVYDLAIEQTTKNDYFAWAVMLWDQKRNYVFVVDAGMERCSFKKQAKIVIDNARKWRPNDIIIEHGGYQGSLASFLADETPTALPIWPFRTRGRSKERRVTEASPLFEGGKVYFHPKFDPRKNPDIVHTAPVISQITSFPFDKFDDLADAVTMGLLVVTEIMPTIGDEEDDAGFEQGDGMNVRMMAV